VLQSDAERARQLAGAIGRQFDSGERFDGADEHAARNTFRLSHDIQAVVHTVDQVHVGVSRTPENDPRAPRQTASAMRGRVVLSQIRFYFDDARRRPAMPQNFSKQVPRHVHGGPRVESPIQRWHRSSSDLAIAVSWFKGALRILH